MCESYDIEDVALKAAALEIPKALVHEISVCITTSK